MDHEVRLGVENVRVAPVLAHGLGHGETRGAVDQEEIRFPGEGAGRPGSRKEARWRPVAEPDQDVRRVIGGTVGAHGRGHDASSPVGRDGGGHDGERLRSQGLLPEDCTSDDKEDEMGRLRPSPPAARGEGISHGISPL